MYITTKNKLYLLLTYLVFVISVGLWIEHEMRSALRVMKQEASELLVSEVLAALHEPLMQLYSTNDGAVPGKIQSNLISTVEHSETLVSLDAVLPDGQIKASSDTARIGTAIDVPDYLFIKEFRPKLIDQLSPLTDQGVHTVWAPVIKQGTVVGYMRLVLQARDVAKVFNPLYRSLIISVIIGLIALLILDLFLHQELTHVSTELIKLLQSAIQGDPVDNSLKKDEFTPLRDIAGALAAEIKNAKQRVDRVHRELNAVTNHLRVGFLFVDKYNQIEFINDQGKVLLAPNGEINRYQEALDLTMQKLQPAIETLQKSGKSSHSFLFSLGKPDNSKQFNAELYRIHDLDAWEGCVILLNDQDFINLLHEDLQNAARSRSLSILLLGALHDVRAPIFSVMMNLELLTNSLIDNDSAMIKDHIPKNSDWVRYLAVIRSELERLNQLINSLYSETMQDNKAKYDEDLGHLINEFCNLLLPQARSQKVVIQFQNPPYPVIFSGYPGQIKQALLNVLLNALEMLPKGGQITISLHAKDGTGYLSICDTGPGIPAALKSYIFDLHFTTKTSGTGIGLYVTKSILEKHGGTIRVDSEYGQGACFEITLPVINSPSN